MNYRLKEILPQFAAEYLMTAAWSTSENDSECQEFTKEAKKEAELHCAMFFGAVVVAFGKEKALDLLTKVASDNGFQAAHDFWLTRVGHGSGFWDREEIYGEDEAKKLTEISKALGEVYPYHLKGPKSKWSF